MWLASRLSPAGKTIACSTIRSFRHACTCPPIRYSSVPKERLVRSLYDCPAIPVGPEGTLYRVVVATHSAGKKSPIGVTRAGIVYELFFTNLPQHAFTACDVVELYLHRGAFEPTLSDEDREQDPDRWCSHAAWGQECWQTVSQWVWNLRLEVGHQLSPTPLRITEFAPAILVLQCHLKDHAEEENEASAGIRMCKIRSQRPSLYQRW
jgi:hypothetical protein